MSEIDARRLAEAAAWRSHLTQIASDSSEAFEVWLADPHNSDAWRDVQRPWEAFGEQAAAPEVLAARRAALGRAREAARNRYRSKGLFRGIAAAFAVAAVGAGLVLWDLDQAAVYQTKQGERRVITLADGSTLSLDSSTDVRVKLNKASRDLSLLAGQARFDVAHDATRPFSVVAGSQRVVATGTAFNVDLSGPTVRVTLIEGKVTVIDQRPKSPQDNTAANQRIPILTNRRADLRAGEQLVAGESEPPTVVPASLERTTAWQNGQLSFEDEPLSTVVARVSRYTTQTLTVPDQRAAELRISGVFNTGDLNGFVETITHYLPVKIEPGDNGSLVLRRSD